MDKIEQAEDALGLAVDALDSAAKDIVQDAVEAGQAGEQIVKFTLDNVGDALRAIEGTLKGIVDDIKTLKGTHEESTETEEKEDHAVDFQPPAVEDSSAPPEMHKPGIRGKRKSRRNK